MHALVQSVGAVIAALATAAFAHFGVTVKPCSCPKAQPAAIRNLTMSAPVLAAPLARRPLRKVAKA